MLALAAVGLSLFGPLLRGESAARPDGGQLKAASGFRIKVSDTGCRIMIAQVHLSIGDLVLHGEDPLALTGTYSIEVPMRSSKNETGGLILPLEHDVGTYLRDGGQLKGRGISFQRPEAKRSISCRILPSSPGARTGRLLLAIDTGERVMNFETDYTVEGVLPSLETSATAGPGSRDSAPVDVARR